MSRKLSFMIISNALVIAIMACQTLSPVLIQDSPSPFPTNSPEKTLVPINLPSITPLNTLTSTISPRKNPTPTLAPTTSSSLIDVSGIENDLEPISVSGIITYTSPFFEDTLAGAFVLLEDQAGLIHRNEDFEFPLNGQIIGPIEIISDEALSYQITLPAVPQGTLIDIDNNSQMDLGVQVFAIAYWSNTWNGPFIERRDGTGWSSAYASTITDPDRGDEISGGILIIWVPDNQQGFPTGFGEDNLLFTSDDPIALIPAGYNIVDINQDPFYIYKEKIPQVNLYEGTLAVNDFSDLEYVDAFNMFFEKVSVEYPFTSDKGIDWDELYYRFAPLIADSSSDVEYYQTLHEFILSIPDGHVGMSFNDAGVDLFYENYEGSFGLILSELTDGRVIVKGILEGSPAAESDIEIGAEIIKWGGEDINKAIAGIEPFFGPYSTEHHKRLEQLVFLTRYPHGTEIKIVFENHSSVEQEVSLKAVLEFDSLFLAIPSFAKIETLLPIDAISFDDIGLGYIRISTFSDDYNLMAQLWDRYITEFIDAEISGLILDLRVNGGGSGGLSRDFAGYFFDEDFNLFQNAYFNSTNGEFEYKEHYGRITPGPLFFDGHLAVLVGPYCLSACEGFVYSLSFRENTTLIGHYPTAGAYGEVGRGQYELPGDISVQFPTGRYETLEGELMIEGTGVIPDLIIPITEEDVLGNIDAELESAVRVLLENIDQ